MSLASKFLKPKLIEYIPGQKRVYQNFFGTKTSYNLNEATKTFGDIVKSKKTDHWRAVIDHFDRTLPEQTPITIKTFKVVKTNSFLSKVKNFLLHGKFSATEKDIAYKCDEIISGKVVSDRFTDSSLVKNGRRKIIEKNCKELQNTYA